MSGDARILDHDGHRPVTVRWLSPAELQPLLSPEDAHALDVLAKGTCRNCGRTPRDRVCDTHPIADSLYETDAGGEGHWVTVSGHPVFISGPAVRPGWHATSGTLDAQTQSRLTALKVPPGWTNVQINGDPKADLQVVGRDSKGRAQYIYSAQHSETAAAEKFERLKQFDAQLEDLRSRIADDLANPNLPTVDREAAAVLTVIDRTGFRVGSDTETGAAKQAYGASTLRAEHVAIDGDKIAFNFTGKKGVEISKTIHDGDLAVVLAPRVATGGRLFAVSDSQVRDYLHSRDGDFKVKDFRTWNGTAVAIREINGRPVPVGAKAFVKAQRDVSKVVAAHLGNTPAVALRSYIDPAVWSRWKA